jgi:outer membrane protein assembly factor BamD (BamD/ComL family)
VNRIDSAYYWLDRSVSTGHDRPNSPRALFILADIVSSDSARFLSSPGEYYERIVSDFPESAYAEEATLRLGKETQNDSDPGYTMYREAENILQSGRVLDAAVLFDSVSITHPASSYAVRGMFASGWVYDNMLGEIDSATHRYERVLESGSDASFVQYIRTRLTSLGKGVADTASTGALPADSLKPPPPTLPSDEDRNNVNPSVLDREQ